MRQYYAYSFTTSLAPADVFRRLRADGTWTWIDRDSDRWGDYVSAVDAPGAIVKVIPGEPAPDRWTANVAFECEDADADAQAEDLRETLVDRILPAIGARDVRESGYLE
jgi:hypothetical protein